jgi:phosphoglycolate phosphatase
MPGEDMLGDASSFIFDLDGTISDPSLGISRCFNYALRHHDFPEISPGLIAAEIGPPLDETFEKFQPQVDRSIITSLVAKYRERYADIGYSENQLYPGVSEAILALRERGMLLGVCTSKRRDFAEKILSMFGLLEHFSFVDGGDVGIKKRDQLSGLLQAETIGPSAVMIGDRAVDISAARANGLHSAGVLWGFGDMAELSRAGADAILRTTGEIAQLGS